jgi:hypothetical protein
MTEKVFEIDSINVNLNKTIFNDSHFQQFYSDQPKKRVDPNNILINQYQPLITAFPLQLSEEEQIEEVENKNTQPPSEWMNPYLIQTYQSEIGGILSDSSSDSEEEDDENKDSSEENEDNDINPVFQEYNNYNQMFNYHQPILTYNHSRF